MDLYTCVALAPSGHTIAYFSFHAASLRSAKSYACKVYGTECLALSCGKKLYSRSPWYGWMNH